MLHTAALPGELAFMPSCDFMSLKLVKQLCHMCSTHVSLFVIQRSQMGTKPRNPIRTMVASLVSMPCPGEDLRPRPCAAVVLRPENPRAKMPTVRQL